MMHRQDMARSSGPGDIPAQDRLSIAENGLPVEEYVPAGVASVPLGARPTDPNCKAASNAATKSGVALRALIQLLLGEDMEPGLSWGP